MVASSTKMEEFWSGFITNIYWCGVYIYIIVTFVFANNIRIRFQIINKIVRRKMKNSTIRKMSIQHMKLSEAVMKNSKVFSLQMGFLTAVVIVTTTFSFFELYTMLCNTQENQKFLYAIASIFGTLYFSFGLFLIILISKLTMNEGERTLKVLHDGIVEIYDQKRMKRLQIFIMQLQHFNANISCGLFRIDWGVIMMVSFAT